MSTVLLYQEGSRSYAKPPRVAWKIFANIMIDIRDDTKIRESIMNTNQILTDALDILRPYQLVAEWLAGIVPLKVGLNIVSKSFPY